MAWPKAVEPRNNVVTVKYSDRELIQIKLLMKREKISKQEAARRLSFPRVEVDHGKGN